MPIRCSYGSPVNSVTRQVVYCVGTYLPCLLYVLLGNVLQLEWSRSMATWFGIVWLSTPCA